MTSTPLFTKDITCPHHTFHVSKFDHELRALGLQLKTLPKGLIKVHACKELVVLKKQRGMRFYYIYDDLQVNPTNP
jgi:hypothetical protein